jgi:alanine-synthesizing transaminase
MRLAGRDWLVYKPRPLIIETETMTEDFHRIRRLPPYVFAEVNAAKAKARAAAEDIVDLGMGNPDTPTPPHIVAKLIEAVQDPRTHRYSMSKGIPGLRKALAGYYDRRFGVKLDPETEVVATLGSKEGLANLAQAISSPGDTILVPNPSYPIHQFGFIIAGASVRSIPYTPDDAMLKAIDRAVRHSVPKPNAVIVNFPSNPTALTAPIEFYRELVALCRRHELFILSDLAYAELYFGDTPPPSVLEVEGAKDITVCGGQSAPDRGLGAGEILSGLRRLYAHSGGGHGGLEWTAGLH